MSGMPTLEWLNDFVGESNRIEGIYRDPTQEEVSYTNLFLRSSNITVYELSCLVKVYQPDALLRHKFGMDVIVGEHMAPKGGPDIYIDLCKLLDLVHSKKLTPFEIHVQYEHLHPFTDGNGRSGRALWLWSMIRQKKSYSLGFLHTFYYQSLEFYYGAFSS